VSELPPGATPIATDELLAAIGELYVQVRVLRHMVQAQQQQQASPASPNGTVPDAVQQQP
jgi:hypothetical protein